MSKRWFIEYSIITCMPRRIIKYVVSNEYPYSIRVYYVFTDIAHNAICKNVQKRNG